MPPPNIHSKKYLPYTEIIADTVEAGISNLPDTVKATTAMRQEIENIAVEMVAIAHPKIKDDTTKHRAFFRLSAIIESENELWKGDAKELTHNILGSMRQKLQEKELIRTPPQKTSRISLNHIIIAGISELGENARSNLKVEQKITEIAKEMVDNLLSGKGKILADRKFAAHLRAQIMEADGFNSNLEAQTQNVLSAMRKELEKGKLKQQQGFSR